MTATWALAVWVVSQPVANVYVKPSRQASVATQVIYGMTVTESRRQGSWLEVRTEDNYPGWMERKALRHRASAYARHGRLARIDALAAHLYAEPDVTRRAPLLTVPFETRLEVIGERAEEEGRWLEVRLVDGAKAWLQRGDTTEDDTPLPVTQLADFARRFLGLPYTWGGTSSFGYDCSGFTQMICRRRGIAIPRDSRPQAAALPAISKEELAPGDLVFFGKTPDRITHTGIYLGNGEFIHATAWKYPRIQISRLDEPHWAELLVACRRPK